MTSPPRRARRWTLLGLALLPLAGAAILFGLGHPAGKRAPAPGRTGEATPIAQAETARGYAWDPRATTGDDQAGGEPWFRDPDALHPTPARGCPPVGDCVIDFPYHDELLLREHQAQGGRVWVPEAAREESGRYPLIVLLHGIELGDEPDPPHKLLAAPVDLSQVVKRQIERHGLDPVLVAAPSQTRDADASSSLWTAEGFDLESFVDTVDKELLAVSRVRVDRGRISVFGHSGAGCVLTEHKKNGLHRVVDQLGDLSKAGLHVQLLGFMDTCFFGEGGAEFLKEQLAGTDTRVFAMWVEPEKWSGVDRELSDFATTLGMHESVPCPAHRFEDCRGNTQGGRLYKAREEGLKFVYGPHPHANDRVSLSPHYALTRWFVSEALRLYYGEGGAASVEAPSSTSSSTAPRVPASGSPTTPK